MKYHIKTYGCQYNEWDAARINYLLQKLGFISVEPESADVIFIVACAVRKTAVDRMFGQIHNWSGKKIVVTGCILDNDKKKMIPKNVILWDSTNPEQLQNILQIPDVQNITQLLQAGTTQSSFLPIMMGCNNFCTYCAVPYTRGRETSVPFDEVVNNFKALLEKGKTEIMLLGQNVNSYQYNFAKLLRTLNDLAGEFTITFTSNHPKDMTDEVIEAIADCQKVAKEIHLPLQSGSDKILKAMNRPYTQKQYLDLVKKIKTRIPNIKITTDVIVGFAGETEDDFQQTVEIFKKVGYFISYTNKYSPRVGTAAYKLGDPIPWEEKQRRWKILDDLVKGSVVECAFEAKSDSMKSKIFKSDDVYKKR